MAFKDVLLPYLNLLKKIASDGPIWIENRLGDLSEWILQRFPSIEGELHDELESDLQDEIITTSIYFATFNQSVGISSIGGFVTMLSGIVLFLVLGLLVQLGISFPPFLDTYISVVATIFTATIGLVFILSMIYTAFAASLLLLYIFSTIRYFISRARTGLNPQNEEVSKVYKFTKPTEDLESDADETITIHRISIRSFYKTGVYSTLLVILSIALLSFSQILEALNWAIAILPTSQIQGTPVSISASVIETIDAVLPLDIFALLTVRSARGLLVILSLLFVFLIFQHIKRVYQTARLSQFEFTDHSEFNFGSEFDAFMILVKVVLFHLLQGELRKEFDKIRGEVLTTAIAVIFTTSLTYVYAYALLSAL